MSPIGRGFTLERAVAYYKSQTAFLRYFFHVHYYSNFFSSLFEIMKQPRLFYPLPPSCTCLICPYSPYTYILPILSSNSNSSCFFCTNGFTRSTESVQCVRRPHGSNVYQKPIWLRMIHTHTQVIIWFFICLVDTHGFD